MQPPAELGADALPDSVRRERNPGDDQHHRGILRTPPARAKRRCRARAGRSASGHEDQRVQLRRERRAEQPERKRPAPIQESRERADRQTAQATRRRCSARRGRARSAPGRETRCRGRELGDGCAAPGKQEDHQVDRPDRAERHQHLEERVVASRPAQARERRRAGSPGRVLDEDVPVGQAPVEQRVAVLRGRGGGRGTSRRGRARRSEPRARPAAAGSTSAVTRSASPKASARSLRRRRADRGRCGEARAAGAAAPMVVTGGGATAGATERRR